MGLISRTGAAALREQTVEANSLNEGRRIADEFIEQLDVYYSSPNSSFYKSHLERKFYEQKIRHLGYKPYPNDGLVTFGASGTNKCDGEVFFRNQKVKAPKSDDLAFRGRQRRVGTAVIDFVQLDLIHMPAVLGDKAKFKIADINGEFAFEDAAQQRTVFEYDGVQFAITAKPDGILEYEDRQLLFEYKTKASGIVAMNGKLDFKGAQADHLRQVTAESLVFGIREGIILYESTEKPSWFSDEENKSVPKTRKTWRDGEPLADIRAFYFYITDDMQKALLSDLARQAKLVYDGVKPKITADMTKLCGFCPYFGGHCQSSLSAENLTELREIEANMSRSSLAGKVDHRKLIEYLKAVKEAE